MSMTVPLPAEASDWGWIPLAAGLAVRDALTALAGERLDVALKWPNDVLVRRTASLESAEFRKVCGILCEGVGDVAVVGIGVNVAVEAADLPVPTATSLQLEGVTAPDALDQVVTRVARTFADRYAAVERGGAALEELREAYRVVCATIGSPARIHLPGGDTVSGIGAGVDDDGRLVLDSDGGVHAYAAGDVVHVRRPDGIQT